MSENRQTIRGGVRGWLGVVLGAGVVVFIVAGAPAQSGLTLTPPVWQSVMAPKYSGLTVKLSWTRAPDATVSGYRVYYGTNSGKYKAAATVGDVTNATIDGLAAFNTYYFAAVSYTTNGVESVFSNEVTNYAHPKLEIAPYVFRVTARGRAGGTNVWQVSTNGAAWTAVLTNAGGGLLTLLRTNNGTREFVRLK